MSKLTESVRLYHMQILDIRFIANKHLILEMEVPEIVQTICHLDAIAWVLSKYDKIRN